MKPNARLALAMRRMTDGEAMAMAERLASDADVDLPSGLTGKTTLRIVARTARLGVREYGHHKDVLLSQLALMGA